MHVLLLAALPVDVLIHADSTMSKAADPAEVAVQFSDHPAVPISRDRWKNGLLLNKYCVFRPTCSGLDCLQLSFVSCLAFTTRYKDVEANYI